MGDYIVVALSSDDPHAPTLSADLRTLARKAGLQVTELGPDVWLGVSGPVPPRTLVVGAWTLIGDVFDRRAPRLPPTRPDDPWGYERKMVARIWGRYVGVRCDGPRRLSAILRDPSGALECIAWTQAGLTVIASSVPDWVLARLRPAWTINVERLGQALRDPLMSSGPLLFDGPVAIDPGTVQPLPLELTAEPVWRPSEFARLSLAPDIASSDAQARLRDGVREAVTGLAGLTGPVAAEVSGGLDSSIVAATLVESDPQGVSLWINAFGAAPEADERPYVMALSAALGIEPLCVPHATAQMTEAWLERASQGLRPGVNGLDRPHDRDWAARFQAAGVKAVMTGKGGDSILLQRSTPEVFTDLWRAKGWRALLSADVARLAATNEVSVWTMLAQAMRQGEGAADLPLRSESFLTPVGPAQAVHPWLEDSRAFGPAKTMQIAGVLDSVSRHGPSMLTEAVDVRHPLCAQPVIEACLAIPTPLLTLGGRDRGLARQAFRGRLPDVILDRRSKGDMTRIYGRMILDNLPVLRGWLLDGRLAALGLVDREILDRTLTRETLIWRGRYSSIMVAAAFEGWVRAWERRLGPASPPRP